MTQRWPHLQRRAVQPFTGVLTCSCPAGARCLPRGPTTSGSSACAQAQRKHNTQLKGCLLFPAPAGARYLPRGPITSGTTAACRCCRRTRRPSTAHGLRSLVRAHVPCIAVQCLQNCAMPAQLYNACTAVHRCWLLAQRHCRALACLLYRCPAFTCSLGPASVQVRSKASSCCSLLPGAVHTCLALPT